MESPHSASNLFVANDDERDTFESGMSALSAVEKLLIEAGTPLNYLEITKQIIQRGFWKTEGKTPEATINAQLAVDIKKHGCDS